MHFHLTAGQTHESTVLDELLVEADACLTDSGGHPFAWPVAMVATRDTEQIGLMSYLLELGITPVIPSKETDNHTNRMVEFDREKYRRRNIVERLIGWLKESRRIFSRFEKTATNFGGMLKLAFIERYLRLTT